MRQLLFGNAHTDFLQFRVEGVSALEASVAASADLQAGWFRAALPLLVTPEHLADFVEQLSALDRTLKGTALLRSTGLNGAILILLEGLPRGHIRCAIEAELDGNSLKCQFRTDQTQLGPLRSWWKAVLDDYKLALGGQDA